MVAVKTYLLVRTALSQEGRFFSEQILGYLRNTEFHAYCPVDQS